MKLLQIIRLSVVCLSLCKDVRDKTGDVQCTILVLRDGVRGNGGSVSLASLVCFTCNNSFCASICVRLPNLHQPHLRS